MRTKNFSSLSNMQPLLKSSDVENCGMTWQEPNIIDSRSSNTTFISTDTAPSAEQKLDIGDSNTSQSLFTDKCSSYPYSDTSTMESGNQSNAVCYCTELGLRRATSYASLDTSIPSSSTHHAKPLSKAYPSAIHTDHCLTAQPSLNPRCSPLGSVEYRAKMQNVKTISSNQSQPDLQIHGQDPVDLSEAYSSMKIPSLERMSLEQVVQMRGLHTSPTNYTFAAPKEDSPSSIGDTNYINYGVPLLPENMQPEQESSSILRDTNFLRSRKQFDVPRWRNSELSSMPNTQKQLELQYGLLPRASYISNISPISGSNNKSLVHCYSSSRSKLRDDEYFVSGDQLTMPTETAKPPSSISGVSSLRYALTSGKTQYKCGFCDRMYTRHSRLKKHVLTKHSGKKFVFKCNICFKTYTSKENLNRHMNIHTGKYRCPKCGCTHDRAKRFRQHLLQCMGKVTDPSDSNGVDSN